MPNTAETSNFCGVFIWAIEYDLIKISDAFAVWEGD